MSEENTNCQSFEEFERAVDPIIKEYCDNPYKSWLKQQKEWLENQDDEAQIPMHYKHYSKGSITVYGNSCTIKEEYFAEEKKCPLQKDYKAKFQRALDDLNHMPVPGNTLSDRANFDATGFNVLHRYKEENEPPTRKANDITTFTKKSRLNMLKKLNKVDFNNGKQPYFITLTYPGRYPTDSKQYKSDLDVFIKRMKREFGELAYLWRLEAQKRGAPHYHFIIYFEKEFKKEYLKHWVSQNWFEVVQRSWLIKDERHLRAGTNVKSINGIRQAMCYVSKYMTKDQDDGLKDQGRYWAASQNWGDLILESFELSSQQLIQFRRLMRTFLKENPRMSKRVARTQNIEVWGGYEFILDALKWVTLNF